MKAAYDKAMERTILNFELLINTKESSFRSSLASVFMKMAYNMRSCFG
jgi:hypothetical protein